MKLKFALYALILLAMSLAVPWFFSAEAEPDSETLPGWVVYAIAAAAAYALVVAICIQFFWGASANDDDPPRFDS